MTFSYIDFHTHFRNSKHLEIVSYRWPNKPLDPSLPFSIGLHPWDTDMSSKVLELENLESYIESHPLSFIGETGLDRLKGSSIDEQIKFFKFHIELSNKYERPLVIHCVRSLDIILRLKKESNAKAPWIIHDFNANKDEIRQCLKNDLYFSVGQKIFKDTKISKSIAEIPIDRIFFETDEQQDYPIDLIYEEASRKMNIELSSLIKQIKDNYNSLLSGLSLR